MLCISRIGILQNLVIYVMSYFGGMLVSLVFKDSYGLGKARGSVNFVALCVLGTGR